MYIHNKLSSEGPPGWTWPDAAGGTGKVTEIHAHLALTASGWERDVRVVVGGDGRIVSVAPIAAGEAGASHRSPRHAPHRAAILLPAPVNAHSHAFQRAMAGLTERRGPDGSDSFWTWRRLMFRFLDRLTPDHVEAIAAFVQMEMLEAGYAASVEFHYLHHQPGGAPYGDPGEMSARIAAASDRTGIGLTLLPVHYEFGGCDRRPLAPGQSRFGNDFDAYCRLHERCGEIVSALPADCRTGIAPHSLRAVAAHDLPRLKELAGGAPFHMHLAEQEAEVAEVQTALGARPVEWVLANLEPGPTSTFIHCTQMLPHETQALARCGAVAGLCPITESSLGDGIFDGVRWFGAGGRIAIGSDSNIRIALAEELRTLEYSQRLRDRARAVLATPQLSTGRRLFEAACLGGAQAAGRPCGAIAPGMFADLLALDTGAIDLAGRSLETGQDAVIDSFIFGRGEGMVSDVWSAGRHVVRGGRHVAHDAIEAAYRGAMLELGDAI
jgi:formimidoylglutamate deiminase